MGRADQNNSRVTRADTLMNSRRILIIVLLGLVVRLCLMALPGTEDMRTNQIWGARAVAQGITQVYIYDDADYLYKASLALKHVPVPATATYYQTQLGPLDHVPDYPPLSVYAFWLSARAAQAVSGGRLAAGPLLNALFNVLPVLCSLGILLLVWQFARREGLAISPAAVAAFWLNPVLILHTPVLGYVDAVFALLELGSLVALFQKKFAWSAALLALAGTTKPQAVLTLPIAALVIWMDGGWRGVVRPALIFALTALFTFLPFVATGRFLAALRGAAQVGHVGYLSSQQLNLWWIVTWIYESLGRGSGGLVTMLHVEDFPRWFLLDVRLVAMALWTAFILLNLRWLGNELREGNRLAIFWAGALQVYGFTMLSLYPWENHLYAFFVCTFPVLLVPKRRIAALFAALSLLFGLNLFLFDGFGRGMSGAAQRLRGVLGFDLTILVAFVNVAVFVWLMQCRRWLFDQTRATPPSALSA